MTMPMSTYLMTDRMCLTRFKANSPLTTLMKESNRTILKSRRQRRPRIGRWTSQIMKMITRY
jgi:hypothetical protein